MRNKYATQISKVFLFSMASLLQSWRAPISNRKGEHRIHLRYNKSSKALFHKALLREILARAN